MNILGNMTEDFFLKEYWEQKPFVFRKAVSTPSDLIKTEDLFAMAKDEDYETRLIIEQNNIWQNHDGPFTDEQLNPKYRSGSWTLINHNINLYNLEVWNIQKALEFIPSWLFDDAMTTYSTKGSSVGAHIDNYNVFIIQLEGIREWKIQHRPNKTLHENCPIKLLKEFNPDESFILRPGDMIYIPPHIAHHGISQTDSLSLSMGFKSLEDKALLDKFCLEALQSFDSDDFYKTSFKHKQKDTLQISTEIEKSLHKRLLNILSNEAFFQDTLLKFTSTAKNSLEEIELTYEEFQSASKEMPIFKDEFMRISSIQSHPSNSYKVSINEHIFYCSSADYSLVQILHDWPLSQPLSLELIKGHSKFIYQLIKIGVLFFSESNT
ncbi:MAG: cupin domain-containing protein [Bacteriovoracaceae bacterium]|jgi:50S ribosomal protein L16 3-hydroxylase|nr:cupin domain-containing protein [Bacteriovoracaceae bacterium]